MKKLIENLELFNRTSKQFEEAALYRGIDQKNADDFELHWKPALNPSGGTPAEDAHWKWSEKGQFAATSSIYEIFSLECQNMTQGLMFVNLVHYARLDCHKGLELVYVELISTAPWNRQDHKPIPIYKGAGRILLATAISLSHDLEFKGRIGLHSLPGAESWYADTCRMSDLGMDLQKKMKYFEYSEAQAAAFLSK